MKHEEALEKLAEIFDLAKELGWGIAFPQNVETVEGLIIGTDEYIDRVLNERTNYKKLH